MSVVPLQQPDRAYERLEKKLDVINPGIWQGKEPPRRDWMVENCFLRGTVAMLAGDGGKGKSLLMQQLCTCAALGREWLGMTLKPGRALLLACEDDQDELWRRQEAINRSLGVEMADVGDAGLGLKPCVGQDNALVYFDRREWKIKPTELFFTVFAAMKRTGAQYLVIDTATQTFRGNQNDETQVMDYITVLRRLAMHIQGVVILTKHPSMAGRASGSGESGNVAWQNSVRARLYLHDDKDQLVLKTMKSNYAASGGKIPLRWEAGVFVRDDPVLPASPYPDRDWDDRYR